MTGDLSQAAQSNVWERRELAAFIQKRREIIRAVLVAAKPRISTRGCKTEAKSIIRLLNCHPQPHYSSHSL